MSSSPPRALVLDFDGVIIESNEVKTDAFRHVFSRFPDHLDAMMSFHFENISLSRFEKFKHFIRERLGRTADDKLLGELASEFTAFVAKRLEHVPFVPGALEFLREFAPRVPLYLASVTPEPDLGATLGARELTKYFRAVYACPPWTKADAARDVIRISACDPSEILLIGDSPGDLRAADEAGVGFVARDSGIIFHPPLNDLHPDMFAIGNLIRERLA